jgi:isopenicillin N synthase-like dioxygenase
LALLHIYEIRSVVVVLVLALEPAISNMSSQSPSAAEAPEGVPVIDLAPWLAVKSSDDKLSEDAMTDACKEECRRVADALYKYGIICIRDPRAPEAENDAFLDMLEQYFSQPEEELKSDVRPDVSYQVGTTPAFTELPRNHCNRLKAFKDAEKPLSLCPPEKDPKWRFFWRIGERPAETKYGELNAEPVMPSAFPQWETVMNAWGSKLLQAVRDVAAMAAIGFDLPADTFRSLMNHGPHLLAPTASNFYKFGELNTVLAGYHYDLNFLTIHGRSRFPGLYIWTREGKKVLVRVPTGCLLVQAGKQFEYVTGGHVMAGFHEVVVCEETIGAIERAKQANRPLWRISSTLFGHIASDQILQPLAWFKDGSSATEYPPIEAGEQVNKELSVIALAPPA